MRLLMTADAVGGVWTYALDLACGLAPHGVETILAANGPSPGAEALADAAAAGVELALTGLPLDWVAQSPDEVLRAGRTLAELAGDRRVDLVQLNSPAYAAGARFAAPVVGVQHSCTATWWRAMRGEAPWPADFDWRFDLARRGLLACDAVVTPSHAFAAAVQDAYGLAQPPTVVWNGRATLEVALPPACGGRQVFTAGRLWDQSKGMAVLNAAAAHLVVPVVAAGSLTSPGGQAAVFAHLRTPGVLGQAGLHTALCESALFVSPSFYEPFGLSVLEAAQAGRALVLSDIPTFRELWDRAAAFFRPGDAGDLAQTLERLLADEAARLRLAAAAQERSRRYSLQAMAQGMMAVFATLRPARRRQA